MQISTIGVDLAKNVFQIHGVDNDGKVVVRRPLRRKQVIEFFGKLAPCLVGMEACGTAHHWARELAKLGHTAAPDSRSVDPPAHTAHQCAPCTLGRVRPCAEKRREGVAELAAIVAGGSNSHALPMAMRQPLQSLLYQFAALQGQISKLDRGIHAQLCVSDVSRRLETIPGIGVVGATAIAATIADPSVFKTGRDFAAWVGLGHRPIMRWSTVAKRRA